MDHEYAAPGTYVARVTVSDGTASDSASATITVGDGCRREATATPGASVRPRPAGAVGARIRVTEPTDAAVRAAFKSASAVRRSSFSRSPDPST